MIDLVIFDCDGVLVDSEIVAARVESHLLTEAGYEISPEEIAETYSGLNFKEIMLRIEETAGIPLQASLLDTAEKLVDQRLASPELRAVDGVHAAVAAVTFPRCICSNSSPQRLELMLTATHLKPLFGDHIYSALATPSAKPKPAPDVFLYGAKQMGADPAKTIVIEDSIHGVKAAKAAGMRVIGFTGGAHTYPGHADILTEAGAETTIRRWADLKATLAALSEWTEDA